MGTSWYRKVDEEGDGEGSTAELAHRLLIHHQPLGVTGLSHVRACSCVGAEHLHEALLAMVRRRRLAVVAGVALLRGLFRRQHSVCL
jgi:hypothetical protein